MSVDTQAVVSKAQNLGTFIMVVVNRKKNAPRPTYHVVATIEDDTRTAKFKKPHPRNGCMMVFNYTLDRWVNIPLADVKGISKLPVQAT